MTNLKELKSVTDYVALGHTHKCYEIDNWAFNPGSLEITNIDEYKETRGAWLVEVDENNQVNARHIQDYTQRPFQRIGFDVSGYAETKEITEDVLNKVKGEARTCRRRSTAADHRNYSARSSRFSEFAFGIAENS